MDAASDASVPLLVRSTLIGRGREARKISIVFGVSFSAGGSWVTIGGFMASGTTPWFALFSFFVAPDCSASPEGLSKKVGTWIALSLPTFATSEAVLVLEPGGTGAQMARG